MADRSYGFTARLFLAWSIWQGKHGRRVNQTQLGEMLGKLDGDPVAQTTISGWFNGTIPDLYDIVRLAKALGVDPGWMAFGRASVAPGPHDPVMDANRSSPPANHP